jgi:outer membrane protein OmpA-like peptidoglycan-associated protein
VNDSNRGAAIGIGIASGGVIGAVVGHMLWDKEPPAPIKVAKKPQPAKPPAPMLVLKGTNFEFNSAALTPEAKAALAKTVDSLKANAEIRVSVNGYTDNVGPDSYNLTLSKRRAESVKKHLVAGGIDAGRIETQGFGAASPVADNSTPEGRAANRRVEVLKLK